MKTSIRILWPIAATVVLWLMVCAIAGIVSGEGALHPSRRPLTQEDEARTTVLAMSHGATLLRPTIPAADGIRLNGWLFRPTNWNGDAVILLHGQTDSHVGVYGPAELLLKHGYTVLLPDARAHGSSGGSIATYGVLEAEDIRRWFDWLAQSQAPHCIDGLGESMGAAQVLQSLTTVPGYCAVVAESPFASFRDASYDRIGQWFNTGPWLGRTLFRPAVDFGFFYVRRRYSIDLEQDNPAQAVAAGHVPVFVIDGLLDDNLPAHNDEKILAESRARRSGVVLWEPPDAGHCGALGAEPEEYERRVVGWLQSHRTSLR